MSKKILVVEDEVMILTALEDLLNSEGYSVFSVTNGDDAFEVYKREKPHLILLDINLPKKSGYDICREIRSRDRETVILMLTAKQEEVDKVLGLELGADDYIVKPYGTHELLARIKAALRRTEVTPGAQKFDGKLNFGNIRIDGKTLKGYKNDQEFPVSSREMKLLKLFSDHDGEVLDRYTILKEVWGVEYAGTTRTLDQHIAKLRQKIEDNPSEPKYVITVHGEGYRFQSSGQ